MLTARPSKPREKNNKMFPLCLPIPFLSLQKFHKNERTWYSGCSWHNDLQHTPPTLKQTKTPPSSFVSKSTLEELLKTLDLRNTYT